MSKWLWILCLSAAHVWAGVDVVEKEHSISLLKDGKTLWTYHHDPEEGKPYFHPLCTSAGQNFTDLRPADHVWHRGLWFSWKYINGVNYWEENKKTLRSDGETMLKSVKRSVANDQTVTIEMELAYAPAGNGNLVMSEVRTITVSPPDESGVYSMDWSSIFTALDKAELDRTPLPHQEGGRRWGGYAGITFRMNKEVMGGTFTNSHGKSGDQAQRTPASWMTYSVPDKGTVLFMDHPENFSFPTKWYYIDKMPWMHPAIIHDGPKTLQKGETLTLKYRLHISAKPIPAKAAAALWKIYAAE